MIHDKFKCHLVPEELIYKILLAIVEIFLLPQYTLKEKVCFLLEKIGFELMYLENEMAIPKSRTSFCRQQ